MQTATDLRAAPLLASIYNRRVLFILINETLTGATQHVIDEWPRALDVTVKRQGTEGVA